ncbi:hypothetical protein [uncultured Weeksella sp.]|uniref:hypothetical protein n=1 Tax=uncultured Weeksella sp. TaxID=1161389 RepID=UPI00259B272F|nr:hypothetical protein [uncultured Weeksella sp.]
MKKYLLCLGLLFSLSANAQSFVINEKLLIQISKNHAVRMASEGAFLDSYERQKKLYDEINKKVAQVIAIQDYIYQQLKNVNTAILQSKKLYYIYQYLDRISKNGQIMIYLSMRRPDYGIFVNRYYTNILREIKLLATELTTEILNENRDFLMDSMDREILIEKIYNRLRHINGNILYITLRLQNAHKIPYLYNVPIIKNYLNVDKAIVNDIIRKYNYIF